MKKIITIWIILLAFISCLNPISGIEEGTYLELKLPDIHKSNLNGFYETNEQMLLDIAKEEERRLEQEYERLRAIHTQVYGNVWSVARSLVGYKGDCWSIVKLFYQKYSGQSPTTRSYTDYPIAGDLIYYANGGLGTQHWAIYLGDGLALHGNYNGIAQIASVYLAGASNPIYYRVGE